MKFLVAVALILLVGVLDETVDGFSRVSDGHTVFEGVRRLSKVGSLQSGETSPPRTGGDADADAAAAANDDDDGRRSVVEMCRLNGNAETFVTAGRKFETALRNTGAVFNSPEFDASALESNRTDDASHVVTFACSKKDDFKSYVGEIAEAAEMCFESGTKLAIDGLRNLTAGFIEFMCENHGSAFTTFVNNDGMECVSERHEALKTCTRNLLPNSVKEAVAAIRRGVPNEEDCDRITSARICIKAEFEACENTSNVDFIDGVIDYFMTRVCGNEGETAKVNTTEE